jgi:RNA polymerase sigma-70 factor (ECF subfamily)
MDEDGRTIERAKAGDAHAFDSIVQKYQRQIYFLALKMLKNQEDAEEVAQQAFVNAWNKLDTFRGGSAFRTWLYRIALNLATSLLRKKARTGGDAAELAAEQPGESPGPLDRLIRDESKREALAACSTLGDKQRQVVLLRIVHELPYSEIGEIVGCSEQTAKVHFHYGVDNLRKRMMPNE